MRVLPAAVLSGGDRRNRNKGLLKTSNENGRMRKNLARMNFYREILSPEGQKAYRRMERSIESRMPHSTSEG